MGSNTSTSSDISDSASFLSGDLDSFLQIAPLPAFVVDAASGISNLNPDACRLLGYSRSDLLNKMISDILLSDDARRWGEITQRFSSRPEYREVCQFARKDGSVVWCEMFARALPNGRWLVFVNDISAHKEAELSFLGSQKQHWKVQKTEALEKLAGGIAHDFNNFLAVILLQTDMMNLQLLEDDPLRERIGEIKAVSHEAAGTVRQLLAFARRQPMSPAPVVLNGLVQSLSRDLKALVGGKVELELVLAPELGVCFVDQKQIAQALMYLTMNARGGLPDGGTLRIETENLVLNRTDSHTAQSRGSYVQISVTDSGVGMDAGMEEHVFEPFFSPKGSERSAGLGLATVYGIVKQSGGFIWANSAKGEGTTFRIQFPRVDQPEIMDKGPQPEGSRANDSATVLLVDDDRSVRSVMVETLVRSGYRVLEARSGIEALEIARSADEPIHLLLTDLSMPTMSGRETAQKIKEIYPEISVLFISGSQSDPSTRSNGPTQTQHFLNKPFSSSELAMRVREALSS